MSDDDDYYKVLQVQPDAEPEVIEAAYRQLMRKYHPDMAGGDGTRAATLHERAKRINRAYAILRDPSQRWAYDRTRPGPAGPRRPPSTPWHPPEATPPGTSRAAPHAPGNTTSSPGSGAWNGTGASTCGGGARPPEGVFRGWMARLVRPGFWVDLLGSISSLYYFLPGPYEWERGRNKDLLATWMLPPLGVAAWSLSSGRLNLLTGSAPYVSLAAWALLAVLALPLWPSLPRLVLAAAPTALLLTGQFDLLLRLIGVPLLPAWIVAGVFGAVVSARQYLFAVLPTLLLCWVLSNADVGLAAFTSLIGRSTSWLSTGTVGLLAVAGLLGLLGWLTLITWRGTPVPPDQPAPASQSRPMFRRLTEDRVRAMAAIPLRTDRNLGEPVSAVIGAHQEANVVLVRDPWAFVQTDDGREGWAEWILSP